MWRPTGLIHELQLSGFNLQERKLRGSDDEEGEDEPDAPETQLRAVLPKHLSSPRGAWPFSLAAGNSWRRATPGIATLFFAMP